MISETHSTSSNLQKYLVFLKDLQRSKGFIRVISKPSLDVQNFCLSGMDALNCNLGAHIYCAYLYKYSCSSCHSVHNHLCKAYACAYAGVPSVWYGIQNNLNEILSHVVRGGLDCCRNVGTLSFIRDRHGLLLVKGGSPPAPLLR